MKFYEVDLKVEKIQTYRLYIKAENLQEVESIVDNIDYGDISHKNLILSDGSMTVEKIVEIKFEKGENENESR